MRPVLPLDVFDVDEPQVGLVDERRGLKRVAGPLVAHVPSRNPAQLVVDERDELIEGGLLSASPGQQ